MKRNFTAECSWVSLTDIGSVTRTLECLLIHRRVCRRKEWWNLATALFSRDHLFGLLFEFRWSMRTIGTQSNKRVEERDGNGKLRKCGMLKSYRCARMQAVPVLAGAGWLGVYWMTSLWQWSGSGCIRVALFAYRHVTSEVLSSSRFYSDTLV